MKLSNIIIATAFVVSSAAFAAETAPAAQKPAEVAPATAPAEVAPKAEAPKKAKKGGKKAKKENAN